MRDYGLFDKYLSDLQGDIYPQPPDPGHTSWAIDSLRLLPDIDTVLDVGCGEGFLKPEFEKRGVVWNGITLGTDDFENARKKVGGGVYLRDFSFTGFPDEFVDLVYARHSLEHSPFPFITLMEWNRISSEYLLLVAPSAEHWGYYGQNHYSVMNEDQLWWALRRTGWKIIERDYLWMDNPLYEATYKPEEEDRSKVHIPGPVRKVEYRYLCQKVDPIKE